MRLLPIDQLSRGVRRVMPSPYRSPISRPFQVTTNAAVIPDAGSNAASIACCSLAASICGGKGSSGSRSPAGHGVFAGSGNVVRTMTGLKYGAVAPIGNVTQPWLPRNFAVRVTPFGVVMWTAFASRSTTGFPSFVRSANGLVKPPTFCAANSGSSPVMKTAEHMILAKPDA